MAQSTKRIRSHAPLYEFPLPLHLPLRYTTSSNLYNSQFNNRSRNHRNKMIGGSSRTANTSQAHCPSIPRRHPYSGQHTNLSKAILPISRDRVFRLSRVILVIQVSRAIRRTMHLAIHHRIPTGPIQATMAMRPTHRMAGNPRHHPEMAIV